MEIPLFVRDDTPHCVTVFHRDYHALLALGVVDLPAKTDSSNLKLPRPMQVRSPWSIGLAFSNETLSHMRQSFAALSLVTGWYLALSELRDPRPQLRQWHEVYNPIRRNLGQKCSGQSKFDELELPSMMRIRA